MSLKKSRDTADDTNITISFAEVGQDKVFDMLADQTSTASCKTTTTTGNISTTELLQEEETRKHQPVHRKALKLREHPEQGVYVENLRKAPVKSSADILRYLEEGIRRRNESRKRGYAAHTVVTLELTPARHASSNVYCRAEKERSSPESPLTEKATGNKLYGAITPTTNTKNAGKGRNSASVEDLTYQPVVKLHMVDLVDATRHNINESERQHTPAKGNTALNEK